jgi:hypothetical protein
MGVGIEGGYSGRGVAMVVQQLWESVSVVAL